MKNVITEYYKTNKGKAYNCSVEDFIDTEEFKKLSGTVNLIFFSPPFFLNRKKSYGNLSGSKYIDWFKGLATSFSELLTEDGSIVIEMGNGWMLGQPTMSTEPLEALLEFKKEGKFHLCQQFIWSNPAKLPSPAQWVNIERIRVKDSFTHIWWLSKVDKPKANNKNVLVEYSDTMKRLLKRKRYNGGGRPSEHVIGAKSFFSDNDGAIPPSVLTFANTRSNTDYLNYCNEHNLKPHPARMPYELPEFFIRFLTDENDLVFDPFGGSNTTGMVAEMLSRRWVIIEKSSQYLNGSMGRFNSEILQNEGQI